MAFPRFAFAVAVLSFCATALAQESILMELLGSKYDGMVDLLEHASMLSPLEQMLEEEKVKGLTIFAPTDYYLMHKMSPALLKFLKDDQNVDILRKILLHHIVPGRVEAESWETTPMVTTFSGHSLDLEVDAGIFKAGGVDVREVEALSAKDGIVHAINGLLISEDLLPVVQFYEKQTVAESEENNRRSMATTVEAAAAPSPSAVEIAALLSVLDEPQFSDLLSALNVTGLITVIEDLITSGTPFTLFAPTDADFTALGTGQLKTLLANTTLLREVLLYHVVQGKYSYAQLLALASGTSALVVRATTATLPTFGNASLPVTLNGSTVEVGGVVVPESDLTDQSDFDVHSVNGVLIPPGVNLTTATTAAPPPPPAKSAGSLFVDLRLLVAVGALALSSMLLV